MTTAKLTHKELVFLRENNISAADIFQSNELSRRRLVENAKRENKRFFLGGQCKKGRHRIRTTSGHCIQCNPSAIAHQIRHKSEGYVYLAYSQSAGLAKIGMTEKRSAGDEIATRQRSLRRGAYAGLKDWEIIMYFFSGEAGKQEDNLSSLFRKKKVFNRYYEKDGRDQEAAEIYRIPCDKAASTFVVYTHKNKLTLLEAPNTSLGNACTLARQCKAKLPEHNQVARTIGILSFLYGRLVSLFSRSGR
jgi:hypothetical protein